jgi:basic amino acid/polyamine antiporter, APA family
MQPQLKRSINLFQLCFYGLGTILGAGIYVLIGKVAGAAGLYAPIAFFVAALIAAFTGLSYAQLAARFPISGGEALYMQKAFSVSWLSGLVGWAAVTTGLVSAAAISRGFVGYLDIFVDIPDPIAIILLVFFMALLAAWGISQSMRLIAVITIIELIGLGLVLFGAGHHLTDLPQRYNELLPAADGTVWLAILFGAFIAFYAFIGFEDMANVAEEVKHSQKNIPIAIIIAILVSSLLYILIALVAVLALPLEQLSNSRAPLADILRSESNISPKLIGAISLIAVVNGALVQIIMASRLVYGMAKQGNAPEFLSKINPKTQTPIASTVLIAALVLVLALLFPLVTLAKFTSFIILIIFSLVNLAALKLRSTSDPSITYPRWVSFTGLLLSIGLILVPVFVGL